MAVLLAHYKSVEPTIEPVSYEDVRDSLRVTHDLERPYIERLISAARQKAETITARQFITATWKLELDGFASGALSLPRAPAISVGSITYVDTAGASQTVATSVYSLLANDLLGQVVLKYAQSWPSHRGDAQDRVTVTYDAGYGATTATVPPCAVTYIFASVAHMYENRSSDIPHELRTVLNPIMIPFSEYVDEVA